MALYLITGLPGSGKSTVCAELKNRGFAAFDGDYDHLAHWYNVETGSIALEPHSRTKQFLDSHSRNIDPIVVNKLASNVRHTAGFLCADPENEDELAGLFTKIFALKLDETIRQQRLASRTNNQWGKLPLEIAYDLTIKPLAYRRYQQSNYAVIDGALPTKEVVDTIIASL